MSPRATARVLQLLPLAVLFLWVIAASFHPVANFDIWVHLKVGLDVLATGEVPRVNSYSWTGAGRPFVAHEWLAGVVFELVASPTEGDGLTVLRVWLVALTFLAAVLVVPREERGSLVAVVFLAVTMVLVISRAAVRPHLFSLFFSSVVVVSMTWWRELRRPWPLLPLPPLTALWANLHGAFLLCPSVLVIVGVAAGAASLAPRLSPGDAPWTMRQAAQPLVVAAAALVASLANPYGAELLGFSLTMGASNEHIKALILEWLPPYAADHRRLYDPWLFFAYLAALLGGLVWQRRRASLVDVALVAAFGFLAMRSIRFVADFALFALPVAVRLFAPVARAGKREAWLALVVAALVLGFTLVRGPSYRTGTRLPFQWGLVRARAADMSRHLEDIGYRGGVFNEYEDGGYLVYAGKGRFKPVIDARIDVFGAELVGDWVTARAYADQLPVYLDAYGVDAVLLHEGREPYDGSVRALLANGAWRVEKVHEGYTLLLRRKSSS